MKNIFRRSHLAAALASVVIGSVLVTSFAAGTYTTQTFPDVPKTSWCYPYIEEAAEMGFVSGYSSGNFGPNDPVSYAQFSVMLTQGFFHEKVQTYNRDISAWYMVYTSTANSLGLFNGTDLTGNGYANGDLVGRQLNRYEMAQMLYNALKAAGVNTNVDLSRAAAETEDWNSIPAKYHEAVAAVKAAGLITGTNAAGRFGGDGKMNRAQSAVVMVATNRVVKEAAQTDHGTGSETDSGADPGTGTGMGTETPTNPDLPYGPVGTMSDFKVTLSLDTHKPVVDYWSKQKAEIQELVNKDTFNAAVQSMKDAELIFTEGAFGTTYKDKNLNLYYNYAMCDPSADEVTFMTRAIGYARMCAYEKYFYGVAYRSNTYRVTKCSDAEAKVFAEIFAKFPSNATDKQKVEICMAEIVKRFDYETGGAGFTWLSGTRGNCESYAHVTRDILAAAGIPSIYVKGSVKDGAHAWDLALIDGTWMVVDGTSAEVGRAQPESISAYNQRRSAVMDQQVEVKVGMAIIEASLA